MWAFTTSNWGLVSVKSYISLFLSQKTTESRCPLIASWIFGVGTYPITYSFRFAHSRSSNMFIKLQTSVPVPFLPREHIISQGHVASILLHFWLSADCWAPSQHSRPSAKGLCLLSWFQGFGLGDEVICLVSLVFRYINASSKPCQIRFSIGYLKYMLLKYLNRSAICLNRPSPVNQQERWEADPARHEPVGRGAGS